MNKNSIILTLGFLALTLGAIWAADNLGSQFSSGTAVKNAEGMRWQFNRQATTTTSLTSVTNVVLSTPGVVAKLIFLAGSAGDVVEIHTASTTTGCNAANELFVVSTNATALGLPITFDFAGGNHALDATNGVAVILKPATTTIVERAFITFDRNR